MNKAAHNLSVWLAENEVSKTDFAGRVGVKPWTVSRWLGGTKVPNIHEIARIEKVTNCKIRALDWVAPHPSRRTAEAVAL